MNTSAEKWMTMWEGRQIHYFLQFVEPALKDNQLAQEQTLRILSGITTIDSSNGMSPFVVNHFFQAARLLCLDESQEATILLDSVLKRYTATRVGAINDIGHQLIIHPHGILTVPRASAALYPDEGNRYDSSLYLLAGDRSPMPTEDQNQELTERAMDLLRSVNLHYMAELSIGLIVNLDERSDGEAMSGYTLSPFTGTIFTDYTMNRIRYAETIAHESAHSFLNCMLQHREVRLDSTTPFLWSPWKRQVRPLFGIVHGYFAFSIVVHYYNRLLEDAPSLGLTSDQVAYCNNRLTFERERLSLVHAQVDDVLKAIGDPPISEFILNYSPLGHNNKFRLYVDG